ncbi:MAG: glutamate synthase (NADPH), homotetrameric [Nitrospirae bacterium GWC2_56_14]|nr:MAG: glutamate synthase (NADPH), homotetrameric [Nitrospirae bacterium GWC2_56_14]
MTDSRAAKGVAAKKIAPKKTPIPEQDSQARRSNFGEVSLGYTPGQAKLEAARCLNCAKPACVSGCPVGVPIPRFIQALNSGNISTAFDIIKEANLLPAVCGRVCPQESQCEQRCTLGKKFEPVAIGRLERFAADWIMQSGLTEVPKIAPSTNRRVAIVGSGPAGLACAYELAKAGHAVTIYEAFHEPGGVLLYGIPEFRLPKRIVAAEIEVLRKMGVQIVVNAVVGKLISVDELLSEFDACFVATGAGTPKFMCIEGENLNGVYSANEFLTRINFMRSHSFPEYDTPIRKGQRIAVVGGGNVAMDSVRTALRLGAGEGIIVYRRSEEELPARREEVHHAREEGVRFELLTDIVRIIGRDGSVSEIECIKMGLGEPDAGGRRKPVAIKGSEFRIPVDMVIMSIGTNPNPLVPQSTRDLALTTWGYIVADDRTGETSRPGLYAGGDIVTGSATVISAMGAGRRAAEAIHGHVMRKQ